MQRYEQRRGLRGQAARGALDQRYMALGHMEGLSAEFALMP